MAEDTTIAPKEPRKKIKKGWKIALLSVGSLVTLMAIAVCVACWLVFTPARLTGIVNKLSSKFLVCESHFERVDLTLFKTFPNVGLEIKQVQLIYPKVGAPDDTLASIDNLTVGLNLKAFLKSRDILVQQMNIEDVDANLFIDSTGGNNFSIFKSDTTQQEDTMSSKPLGTINIEKVNIKNLNATYTDQQHRMTAQVKALDLHVKGSLKENRLDATLKLGAKDIAFAMRDSAGTEIVIAKLKDMEVGAKAKGDRKSLDGRMSMALPKGDVELAGTQYVNESLKAQKKEMLKVEAPFHANLDAMEFSLADASLALAQYVLDISGDVTLAREGQSLNMDIRFATNGRWPVKKLISILPAKFTTWSKGMDVDGDLSLDGTAKGSVGDSVMPLVTANVKLSDGSFKDLKLLPYEVKKINGDFDAALDISSKNARPSIVKINRFSAKAASSKIEIFGVVNDLLNDFFAKVNVKADVPLADVKPFLPKTMPLKAEGKANLNMNVTARLSQLQKMDLNKMKVEGRMNLKDLNVAYDSMTAQSAALGIDVLLDPNQKKRIGHQLLTAKIFSKNLKANVGPANIDGELKDMTLNAAISNIMDSTVPFALACDFDLGDLKGSMDDIIAHIVAPKGTFTMQPNPSNPGRVKYYVDYNSGNTHVRMNDSLSMDIAGLSIKGAADYDSTRSNVLQKWSPDMDVNFKLGYLHDSQLPYILQIPDIKFKYKPERCEIQSANVVFGNSDYYLSGVVTGLEKWLDHEDMLRGDLNFTSNYTNVDDLLEVFSGMGNDQDTLIQQRLEDNVAKEANPFIVPKDVDLILHTRIREALAYGNNLQDLAGDVRIKDGVAVLDQVGFVCKAARMQLTGMYRTPRVNHIFMGFDFHLLDINISELIDMIPMVDSLVPMLSSFDGHANFHLAAETYVNAFYKPKMSTLRGAMSITGDSLVVLDTKTFETISKYLLFKKGTKNVIDSLDVQMTVFRKEVEVFPFLLTMDKYQVCAAGRHNLDNNYDYHLEILKSPLPMRLALDVKGVMPKLGFSLSKCRYAELFKPEKRNDVQEQTLKLKRMIRESLEANVKESTREYQGLDDK
ncbi:MAG: AsmA-like C-terminal region-containing protein [Bacteroidales bacterium]|nr:AsmA-like C-terminal region-containing protein [Bacteroidales bacterium]